MIVDSAQKFLDAYGDGAAYPAIFPSVMKSALLVSPNKLRLCEEALKDNHYMDAARHIDVERSLRQHQGLHQQLVDLEVPVLTFRGLEESPDSIFPNNVYGSTEKAFIVGSMRHSTRRLEAKRSALIQFFQQTMNYEIIDLSKEDFVAELTGVYILDRARKIGYCGLTSRVDKEAVGPMHEAFGMKLTFQFSLVPGEYHTNIILSILAGRVCVMHTPSFQDPEAAEAIAKVYGENVIRLTDDEKANFAGNCIAVTGDKTMLSQRALDSLTEASHTVFERSGIVPVGVPIDEIEKAGGSLRCLIAELY
ncbi:MAG: arginine deiminase-related protein [Planctomycetota bacterium]|nr:arginine deiminase-related protein [Planctomycetota bacterium]